MLSVLVKTSTKTALAFAIGLTFPACGQERTVSVDTLDGLVPRGDEREVASEASSSISQRSEMAEVPGLVLRSLTVPQLPTLERTTLAAIKHLLAASAEAQTLHGLEKGEAMARTRRLLEAIIAAGDRVSGSLRTKIEPYARRWLVRNSAGLPLDCSSPAFIPGELAAAAQQALLAGKDPGIEDVDAASSSATRLDKLEVLLKSVLPVIFSCDRGGELPATTDSRAAERHAESITASRQRLATLLESAIVGVSASTGDYLGAAAKALAAGEPATNALGVWARSEGQLEVYVDWQAGVVGDMCLVVALRDEGRTVAARKVVEKAPQLEKALPILERLKRPSAQARGRTVVVANAIAGFCPRLVRSRGVVTWPEPLGFADEPGKLLILSNVAAALRAQATSLRSCAMSSLAILAEGLGAPTGKASHLVKGDPGELLADKRPFVEALRRRLIALYATLEAGKDMPNPFDVPDCAPAFWDEALEGPRDLACEVGVTADERLAQTLIIGRLDAAGALPPEDRQVEKMFVVADTAKAKAAISTLLAEVQRVASSGDILAAGRLHEEAAAVRLPRAPLPSQLCVLLMPQVELQRDKTGNLNGLQIHPVVHAVSPAEGVQQDG